MKVANIVSIAEAPIRVVECSSSVRGSSATYESLEDILDDMAVLSKEVTKITTTNYGSDASILTIFVR